MPCALFALALLAAGCGHGAIDRRQDAKIEAAHSRASAEIRYVRCPNTEFGPDCGLILRHTAQEEFRDRFRDRVCATKDDEACELAFQRMIEAELGRRYYAADWESVAAQCDLRPSECDDPAAYELLLLQSHNAHVATQYDHEQARIERERRAKHRAHRAEVAATVAASAALASALLPASPRCRSYPSIYENVTITVCPH